MRKGLLITSNKNELTVDLFETWSMFTAHFYIPNKPTVQPQPGGSEFLDNYGPKSVILTLNFFQIQKTWLAQQSIPRQDIWV